VSLLGNEALAAFCASMMFLHWPATTQDALCRLLRRATALRVADDTVRAAAVFPALKLPLSFRGSWLHNSSAIQQYYGQAQCLEMLEAHEAQRGHRYLRVIYSRFDFFWLAPHPPLRLLDSAFVWVPHVEHNLGINDRHAVLHRAHAFAYLGSWHILLSGKAAELLRSLMKTSELFGPDPEVTAEVWLWARLESLGLQPRFFPCPAFVMCGSFWKSRSKVPCISPGSHKHDQEYEAAALSAFCFARNGSCQSTAFKQFSAVNTILWQPRMFSECMSCIHAVSKQRVVEAASTAVLRSVLLA
jgi:hypothetical protein